MQADSLPSEPPRQHIKCAIADGLKKKKNVQTLIKRIQLKKCEPLSSNTGLPQTVNL